MPAAVWLAEFAQQELGVANGGVDPIDATHCGASLGKRGQEQGVPFSEHFVVEPRARACGACGEQQLAGLFDGGGPFDLAALIHAAQDVAALKVAFVGSAEPSNGFFSNIVPERWSEHRSHFVDRPCVERSLVGVAVSVERVGVLG